MKVTSVSGFFLGAGRIVAVLLFCISIVACSGASRPGMRQNNKPVEVIVRVGVRIPVMPTVVPDVPVDISNFPSEGVLRIGVFRFENGSYIVVEEPKDYPNNEGSVETLIRFFEENCRPQGRFCVLMSQFSTPGGEVLAPGHYANLTVIGGSQEALPQSGPWVVIDSNFNMIEYGAGGQCGQRPYLSVCVAWDGTQVRSVGSNFVLINR